MEISQFDLVKIVVALNILQTLTLIYAYFITHKKIVEWLLILIVGTAPILVYIYLFIQLNFSKDVGLQSQWIQADSMIFVLSMI